LLCQRGFYRGPGISLNLIQGKVTQTQGAQQHERGEHAPDLPEQP